MAGAVGGGAGLGCVGFGRRKTHQGVVDLAHEGGHAGLLGQNPGEEVGERWPFLFGPLRGQDLDHMGDLAREGLELALEGLAVLKKGVLGVIHLVEHFADGDQVVGNWPRFASLASWGRAMRTILGVGQGGLGVDGKEASEAGSALPPRRRRV